MEESKGMAVATWHNILVWGGMIQYINFRKIFEVDAGAL